MLDKYGKSGKKGLTRRRMVSILALAGLAPAGLLAGKGALAQKTHLKWRGALMGARAGVDFYGADQAAARNAMALCLAEVERLEKIFSLYRDDSQIAILNRTGRLAGASLDMRLLLATSHRISRATGGAFDPTVQSLWRLNADWFAQNPASKGPPAGQLEQAQRLVDYRKIIQRDGEVRLGEGQAITLNGIAQGYITDRIVALLRANGWQHVLVGMGEYFAMVNAPKNRPFRLALEGAGCEIELCEEALASSRADGFVFPSSIGPKGLFVGCVRPAKKDELLKKSLNEGRNAPTAGLNGALHCANAPYKKQHPASVEQGPSHLFDPKSGKSARLWQSIHVKNRSATIADGLSTACASMDAGQIEKVLRFFPGTTLWTVSTGASVQRFKA